MVAFRLDSAGGFGRLQCRPCSSASSTSSRSGSGRRRRHTIGPMLAAGRFLDALRAGTDRIPGAGAPARLGCRLHGSLAFTGKGHATDRAVIARPRRLRARRLRRRPRRGRAGRRSPRPGASRRRACPRSPSIRRATSSSTTARRCPATPTAWCCRRWDAAGNLHLRETYYSVGGGFVLTARELEPSAAAATTARRCPTPSPPPPRCWRCAARDRPQRSPRCSGRTSSRARPAADARRRARAALGGDDATASTAASPREGELPGGLKVRRRARAIHERLLAERGQNLTAPHTINDWIAVYAIAVNEENAAGAQVVTAPTNGAAGVVPATLRYFLDHVPGASRRARARVPADRRGDRRR